MQLKFYTPRWMFGLDVRLSRRRLLVQTWLEGKYSKLYYKTKVKMLFARRDTFHEIRF